MNCTKCGKKARDHVAIKGVIYCYDCIDIKFINHKRTVIIKDNMVQSTL